jgi:hypothetical protein
MYERNEKCIQFFFGKSDGKRTLARPRCIRNNYNKMIYKGIGFEDVDWMQLAHDKVKP